MTTPRWDKNKPEVPFDRDGNMMNQSWRVEKFKRVYNFRSEMKILGYRTTNASATFILQDKDGVEYPMYLSDFMEVLMRSRVEDQVISENEYTFRKIGSAYGIMMVV